MPVLGGKINVRSVIPISDGTKFPLLLWFHGGGWTVGDIEMDDPWLRIVSAELKVSIVNVEYRYCTKCC